MSAPAQDGLYLRCGGMDLPKSADDGGRSKPEREEEDCSGPAGQAGREWSERERGHSACGSLVLAVVN
eukprot:1351607-Rhodomonas_salina.1